MSDRNTEKEERALQSKKEALVNERATIQARLSGLNAEVKGSRLAPRRYKQLVNEQAALKRDLARNQQSLSDVKSKLRAVSIARDVVFSDEQKQSVLIAQAYDLILKHFLDTDVVFSQKEKRIIRRMQPHYEAFVRENAQKDLAKTALVQKGDWLVGEQEVKEAV